MWIYLMNPQGILSVCHAHRRRNIHTPAHTAPCAHMHLHTQTIYHSHTSVTYPNTRRDKSQRFLSIYRLCASVSRAKWAHIRSRTPLHSGIFIHIYMSGRFRLSVSDVRIVLFLESSNVVSEMK